MRLTTVVSVGVFGGAVCLSAADVSEIAARRERAAGLLRDGVLLIHANPTADLTGDGFREDQVFFYFTGIENMTGALLAIDGRSGESSLFVPSARRGQSAPEVSPGVAAAARLAMQRVVDWAELPGYLDRQAASAVRVYYVYNQFGGPDLPLNIVGRGRAPLWAQVLQQRWPKIELQDATERVYDLMAVLSTSELPPLRQAAKATVAALNAGIHAIHDGVTQRAVEATVENACWTSGARGVSFWPWVMAGENAVFPRPFLSATRYDHLDRVMRAGELVRLDVGCESQHYQGDLGRTIPVSGHYDEGQREAWNIFVAAYKAGAKVLRDGTTADDVFAAWRSELLRHLATAKTMLARHAIDAWSTRENVPYWQIHTMALVTGAPKVLRAGMTVAFEPIASVDGQGFYLEDMYLVTKGDAENLTPGVPYTAEELEAEMAKRR